jgi:hypothetical protein
VLRAQLKRDLKAGGVSIGALLLDSHAYLETAKVFDMLLASPKVGSVKATRILHSCRVSPSETFGGLSEHKRGTRRAPEPVAASTDTAKGHPIDPLLWTESS